MRSLFSQRAKSVRAISLAVAVIAIGLVASPVAAENIYYDCLQDSYLVCCMKCKSFTWGGTCIDSWFNGSTWCMDVQGGGGSGGGGCYAGSSGCIQDP